MKIVYVTAGAAGMYCGSCMRDNTLVRALRARGVDAALVPTYTPLRVDVEDVSESPIFFGGIGVYLAQVFPPWRRAPRFLSRVLARPALLRLVSRLATRNRPQRLGELAVSILRGEEGNHRRQLEELCDWLAARGRPDLVHLTNSLFAGLAPAISRRLGVPVLCTLQGEDLFLDGLPERHRHACLRLIREHSRSIDLFVAVSEYHRRQMAELAGIDAGKIRVVPPGIPHEEHEALFAIPHAEERDGGGGTPGRPSHLTIGSLARICPEKGVGVLCDAFALLRRLPETEHVRLRIAGYLAPADRRFLAAALRRLAAEGLEGDVTVDGTVDLRRKLEFFESIDIFSAPAVYREPMGLYVLESFAAGVPVVQPSHGAFPELVEATGGGILVEPDDPEALAAGLAELVRDARRRRDLGVRARRGFKERFTDQQMAVATLEIYREVAGDGR